MMDASLDVIDNGELYAIALARAIGIAALVTDDTKEWGPHDVLLREIIEDVIPLAFHELFLMNYLSSRLDQESLWHALNEVKDKALHGKGNLKSRVMRGIKRFRTGTERDKAWIKDFCSKHSIDFEKQARLLENFLDSVE